MELLRFSILCALLVSAFALDAGEKKWMKGLLEDTAKMAKERLQDINLERTGLKDAIHSLADRRTKEYLREKSDFKIPDSEDTNFLRTLLKDTAEFAKESLRDMEVRQDHIRGEAHDFARAQLDHYEKKRKDMKEEARITQDGPHQPVMHAEIPDVRYGLEAEDYHGPPGPPSVMHAEIPNVKYGLDKEDNNNNDDTDDSYWFKGIFEPEENDVQTSPIPPGDDGNDKLSYIDHMLGSDPE